MKRFPLLAIAGLLVLAGCATFRDPFRDIRPGMTQANVLGLLGEPEDRTFMAKREEWHYESAYSATPEKIVVFEDGKVVGLLNDEVAAQRRHEIERARVGAPKINIQSHRTPPNGLSSGTTVD